MPEHDGKRHAHAPRGAARHGRAPSLVRTAAVATLHCLTGCAIGEVLGMVIGTALGLSNTATIALAIVLAFVFGYSLTMVPLLRSGLALAIVLPLAFASDTFSIAVMEVVDNATMLLIPGAMDAGLRDLLFWGALALALGVAFFAAWPLNVWLIARGRGHAVVHEAHHGGGHGGGSPRLQLGRLAALGTIAVTLTVGVGVGAAELAERAGDDGMAHPVPFDRAFIDAMVSHHRSAIELALTARPRLTDPTLKRIAAGIVRGQQGEIDRLLAWRKQWYGSRTLDPDAGHDLGLSMAEMGMTDDPRAPRDPADPDATFAAAMLDHDEGAIRMARLALERAEHREVRRLARRIVAAREREMELLQPLATA